MAGALMIGDKERAAFTALQGLAARHPVDMRNLKDKLLTAKGKAAHKKQMTKQTIKIPFGYLVTYSVETGHPGGTARHMSVSTSAKGRAPNEYAVWMICEELGFTGNIQSCTVWPEELLRGEQRAVAINVVQLTIDTDGSGASH